MSHTIAAVTGEYFIRVSIWKRLPVRKCSRSRMVEHGGVAAAASAGTGAPGEHQRRRQDSEKRYKGDHVPWENWFLSHRCRHFDFVFIFTPNPRVGGSGANQTAVSVLGAIVSCSTTGNTSPLAEPLQALLCGKLVSRAEWMAFGYKRDRQHIGWLQNGFHCPSPGGNEFERMLLIYCFGPDGNTVLPKFRVPVPREDDRLGRFRRHYGEALVS